ncbi:mucin-2-like isoform X2 [Daphnia carinata]|uniref:mucin-2-like isoform X2 n=1 Tax=Daphnia carinata TaxID=120202 RepID=UPI002579CA80|nr:mucin-2-like isoform X2 [Daphnia carinata]
MKMSAAFGPSLAIVATLLLASGYCTEDVTGSEPPTSEAATVPVTQDNGVGTQTMTTSSMQTLGLDVTDGPAADASQSPENNNQTETDLAEIALATSMAQPSDVPVTVSEETITTNQQDVPSPEPSVSGSPVEGTTLTNLPATTVTVQSTSSTTIRQTEKPISTSSITGTANVDHSTAAAANSQTMITDTPLNSTIDSTTSTTVPPTTTNPGTTTRRSTRIPRTTTQRRSSTTTAPLHECVTSTTCLDPNAHCVNLGGHNTCECRMGFRKSSPVGRCVLIAPPSTTTTTVPSTTVSSTVELATLTNSNGQNVTATSSPSESSLTIPPLLPSNNRRDAVRLASNLSTREKMDVVSISFQPASSVVEWLLSQDLPFRKAIAKILSSTNFTIVENTETIKRLNITEDEILYVAPSPQLTAEGLLVCFLVQDKEKATPRHRSFIDGTVARRKRETNVTDEISTGYLPSVWITTAIGNSQHHLEAALNQTVCSLYGGIIPYELLSVEQLAAASLFERRLDIFIPLILVAALGFMGLAVSLVCIRAKTRSMATWDPPAGVVFGKY